MTPVFLYLIINGLKRSRLMCKIKMGVGGEGER